MAVLVVRPGLEQRGQLHTPASSIASQSQALSPPVTPGPTVPSPSGIASPDKASAEIYDLKAGLPARKQMVLTPSPRARNGALIAGKTNSSLSVAANTANPAPPAALAFTPPKGASEMVEVTGASPVVTADASISWENQALARDEAPVLRAKPALEAGAQESAKVPLNGRSAFALNGVAKQAADLGKNTNWMIAGGILQRSLDGGQTWQTALNADHPLTCYALRGQEVWAGGQAGTLMRSIDGGATWSALVASLEGQALASDITQVELRGSNEIILTTSNNENWDSSDGGKTWIKK